MTPTFNQFRAYPEQSRRDEWVYTVVASIVLISFVVSLSNHAPLAK
jgi:hypothetical protein